eukprot:1431094-Rhodomonas_salina.1
MLNWLVECVHCAQCCAQSSPASGACCPAPLRSARESLRQRRPSGSTRAEHEIKRKQETFLALRRQFVAFGLGVVSRGTWTRLMLESSSCCSSICRARKERSEARRVRHEVERSEARGREE